MPSPFWRCRLTSFACCLLLLVPLGCQRSGPPPEEEAHPAPVKVTAAKTEMLGEWTELLGTTQPLPGHIARLSTPVSGRVLAVLADQKGSPLAEGQQVAQKQVLIRLDDRIPKAGRDKAQAVLQELIEQARQAEFPVTLAQLDLDRLEKLKPGGMQEGALPLVSRIELEKARIAVKDADSRQRLAQDKLKTARADLAMLEAELDQYTLRAPIAGRLGLVQVAPGQSLTVGTPVAEILDLDEIDVVCFAPPHLIARLTLGQPVRVAGESGPSPVPQANGKIRYVAVQAESESGSFVVKARFPNPDLRLRAGQVRRVEVRTQKEAARLVVPEAALLEDQDPPGVIVVEKIEVKKNGEKEEKIGKARRLQARVGVRERGRWVELLDPLTDPDTHKDVAIKGALFVVEGGHGLADGDPVVIEDEPHEGKQP